MMVKENVDFKPQILQRNLKKYYASTIDLTGGKSTRALFGICLVSESVSSPFLNFDKIMLDFFCFANP